MRYIIVYVINENIHACHPFIAPNHWTANEYAKDYAVHWGGKFELLYREKSGNYINILKLMEDTKSEF